MAKPYAEMTASFIVDGPNLYGKRRSCLDRLLVRRATDQSTLPKQSNWPNSEKERGTRRDIKVSVLQGGGAALLCLPPDNESFL